MKPPEHNELRQFLAAIHTASGYDFSDYAEPSVIRRIAHYAAIHRIGSIAELLGYLLKHEELFEEFVQDISVTVTQLFRDPGFYRSIREKLIRRLRTYPVLRIWIAGCATGEEAYSLAILLKEEGLLERSIIYATDINQKSLRVARDGIYPLEQMQQYATNYTAAGGKRDLQDYYRVQHHSVVFDAFLRENIVFSPHNLVTDRSFNEFQFIVCRNVLIYFNQHLQNKVIALFYESLCRFGFLGLGNKESLLFSDLRKQFREVDAKERIYARKT